MLCKFSLLRRKEVINLCDGCRLGCVGDVEVTITATNGASARLTTTSSTSAGE